MAKITFSKLGLKKQEQTKILAFNGLDIEVKQYLPMEEKIKLITTVLDLSYEPNNFVNPLKVEVISKIEIISFYTNITFTDKQKQDYIKLYDLITENGLLNKIIDIIPIEEFQFLQDYINKTLEAIHSYKTSVLGILEAIGQDYSNLSFDVENITNKIADPENLDLLKNVLEKLG